MMMRVEPLVPDVAADAPVVTALPAAGGSFGDLVDAAGAVLGKAMMPSARLRRIARFARDGRRAGTR